MITRTYKIKELCDFLNKNGFRVLRIHSISLNLLINILKENQGNIEEILIVTRSETLNASHSTSAEQRETNSNYVQFERQSR